MPFADLEDAVQTFCWCLVEIQDEHANPELAHLVATGEVMIDRTGDAPPPLLLLRLSERHGYWKLDVTIVDWMSFHQGVHTPNRTEYRAAEERLLRGFVGPAQTYCLRNAEDDVVPIARDE